MSALSLQLDKYLKLRRQLGYRFRSQGYMLNSFIRFAENQGASFITTKLALRWAGQPKAQPTTRGNKLAVVRRFAAYLSAFDARTEVPVQKLLPRQILRRPPYLYRDEEVRQLISAAKQIAPDDELKGATHSTLLGLLAVTGMRVGEALALGRGDVDLQRDLLNIRRSKGGKSRWVPLHASTKQALQQYAELRNRVCPKPLTSSFFISEKGTRLLHGTVHRWFSLVACNLGLRKPGDRRGPRIHDLRHYFAIRTMLNWYHSDANVEVHLPELTTYLGHARVCDTYWYVSATPELLKLATLRLQRAKKGEK